MPVPREVEQASVRRLTDEKAETYDTAALAMKNDVTSTWPGLCSGFFLDIGMSRKMYDFKCLVQTAEPPGATSVGASILPRWSMVASSATLALSLGRGRAGWFRENPNLQMDDDWGHLDGLQLPSDPKEFSGEALEARFRVMIRGSNGVTRTGTNDFLLFSGHAIICHPYHWHSDFLIS